MLAKKFADEVVLEPCSQEDIEANLLPTDPGKVSVGAAIKGKKLVIQVKQRSGEPWSLTSISALLNHGGKKRVSAKDQLRDPAVHYLLITSAPLTGVALGLHVRDFGQWPKSQSMPKSLVTKLHKDSAGRVDI